LRDYSFFFSQRREDAKKSYTTFASLRLCANTIFFSPKERKPTAGKLRASILFFSRKEEKAQREIIKPLRLCAFARLFSFFSQRREGAKRSLTTFASLRLCEIIFFFSANNESLSAAADRRPWARDL
jgi:hypothetical protein